jgi:hypothetical protein
MVANRFTRPARRGQDRRETSHPRQGCKIQARKSSRGYSPQHWSEAKGYQPLYHLLVGRLALALPGIIITAAASYISLQRPREFAAISPSANGLRLAFDLGGRALDGGLQKSRIKGMPARLSHMLALSDARLVQNDLIDLFTAADARVNGQPPTPPSKCPILAS